MYEDFVLVSMGLKYYNESLVKRTEAWEASFEAQKRELYKRVHKHCDHRKIALIGNYGVTALPLYIDLLKTQNYDYQLFGLWYRKEYYEEKITTVKTNEDGSTQIENDIRKDYVRVEERIDKKPYLDGEDGLHKWKLKNGQQQSYFVQSTSEDELKLPEDLQRKNIFKNVKERRTYEPTHLKDKYYSIDREIQRSNYLDLIKNALDKRLEKKIDEVLA